MKKENLALKFFKKNVAKVSEYSPPLFYQSVFNSNILAPTFGRTLKRMKM